MLFKKLGKIPHVKRLRFHTRFPTGIPERIDKSFCDLLAETSLQLIFVIHANHPKEFDEQVWKALRSLQCLGIPILHQAVLLRGVNDDISVLKKLYNELIDHGVIPYYLHQLDRVQGGAHFEVSEEEGRNLVKVLQESLVGFAVPRYVKEEAGELSKTFI